MIEVSVVKQKLQDYIVNQIDILGESNPAIKLVKPLAKRAIINNIDSFDKLLLMKCTMSKTVRNISARNTICRSSRSL
jgi:hypothetical protein